MPYTHTTVSFSTTLTSLSNSRMTQQWSASSLAVMRQHTGREVQRLAAWCSVNNFLLNASKTREVVMDWRRKRADPAPLQIEGDCVERVSSFKFLVANNLTCSTNTSVVVGKAQQRLHFLRLLRKCDLDVYLLRSFYHSTIVELSPGFLPNNLPFRPNFHITLKTILCVL